MYVMLEDEIKYRIDENTKVGDGENAKHPLVPEYLAEWPESPWGENGTEYVITITDDLNVEVKGGGKTSDEQ